MAKQVALAQSETAKPAPALQKTEAAPAADRPTLAPAAEKPAVPQKPVATLVAQAPAETSKRRGRPPGKSKSNGQGAKRVKAAASDILFMVETEEGSDRYEVQSIRTVTELFDLMDENRRLVATRAWREL